MSPESEKRSSDRKKQIIEHSNEVLSNMPHTYGTQSFIVSENEARAVGAAISERDHRAINDLFGDAMTAAVEDYTSTNADECIGVWNQTIAGVYGEGVNLHEMLENQSNRELLNIMLTSSEHNQLGLETTEYLKLIETIAILTMPDNGFSTYPSSRQSRVGGSERALFLRSLTLLNSCADAEPGMRSIREGVLNTDKNALNKYLSSTIKANSAKSSLETIIEMDEHEIRRQKAGLERIVLDERSEHDIEVGDLLHVLDWHLLSEKEDRDSRHKRIKAIIEGQAKTERQKRQLYTDWCPERLDFLIEIAERGIAENRDPKMYISNRFEEGAGVYVSVELSNPADNDYKILFADNPLSGNALYIVDELKLENEGRPNNWLNVLGASRRIARERGAIRKYHTKNWQDILPSIMNMGARHEVVSTAAPELSEQPSEIETITDISDTNFESLLKRHKALIDAARQLLS